MTSTAAPPASTFATPVTSSGSGFDWNQAMGMTQSALDAYNNSQGAGPGQGGNAFGNVVGGVQMVNNIASNGLMVGQLGGQIGGAAAACCVM